jgi:DNA-binding transcriptional ArsR family regulator
MKHKHLDPDTLDAVADRFKVLAEPARLAILNALRDTPMSVTTLIDETGLNQANLSKHLQLLHTHGFVERQRHKSWVLYSLADKSVFRLCDIMCGQLDRHIAVRRAAKGKMKP